MPSDREVLAVRRRMALPVYRVPVLRRFAMNEIANVDAHAARSVAGRIRQGIRDYLGALALVKRAWDEEHWRILGYDSWQQYCDGEFGAERLGLPVEHRDKALHDLRLSGMSVRAISATTGVPKSTVADELTRLSDAGQLEQPDVVRSLDGRDRPATSSPTGSETAPIADLPQEPDRSGSTAAEVEASPSADGTETDSGAGLVSSPLAGESPVDGESVPAPTAAAVDNPPAAVGVTLDDWSQQLRDRVADVHEFMTVDFPADAFAAATESDWAEVIDLIEQMAGYGKAIRSAYVARMLEATR